jgi:hypothetical protein
MDVVAKGLEAVAMAVEGTRLAWDVAETLVAEELRQQAGGLMPCHISLSMGYRRRNYRIRVLVQLKAGRWKLIMLLSVVILEQKEGYKWMGNLIMRTLRKMKRKRTCRI